MDTTQDSLGMPGPAPGLAPGPAAEAAAEPAQVHTRRAADQRLNDVLSLGRGRLADGFERVGEQLEERARSFDEAGGLQGQASVLVRRTGEAFDSSADYIRTHEPTEMRDDLEEAIREKPLTSVALALGTGYLIAKLFRA